MKKFSSLKTKNKTSQQKSVENILESLIKKDVYITYKGNVDDIINEKLSIDGVGELSKKIDAIIDRLTDAVREKLYYEFRHIQDKVVIEQMIDELENKIRENEIPSPQQIFSKEDYEYADDNAITLVSLNKIPKEYSEYLNKDEVNEYFENDNTIVITFIEEPKKMWQLEFVNNNDDEYGTQFDGETTKLKNFITRHKNFIADFIRVTINILGSDRVLLDDKLLKII